MKQQNPVLHVEAAARHDCGDEIVEFPACFRMNLWHVDRVGAPQIIFPGYRMLERFAQLVWRERGSIGHLFQWTAFYAHLDPKKLP